MKVVVQRSKNSKVTIDGKVNGSIEHGFVLLSSFTDTDTLEIVDKMIDKILNLRIFEDENEKMNVSLLDVKGSILNISQFTLYADCSKGRRPSFVNAMKPDEATKLYDYMNEKLKKNNQVKNNKILQVSYYLTNLLYISIMFSNVTSV